MKSGDGAVLHLLTQAGFWLCVSSAAVQPEDGDGEDPGWEGPAADGAAGLPHRAGSPAGGALSPAKQQQGPH